MRSSRLALITAKPCTPPHTKGLREAVQFRAAWPSGSHSRGGGLTRKPKMKSEARPPRALLPCALPQRERPWATGKWQTFQCGPYSKELDARRVQRHTRSACSPRPVFRFKPPPPRPSGCDFPAPGSPVRRQIAVTQGIVYLVKVTTISLASCGF
jgi:hypothetical protein